MKDTFQFPKEDEIRFMFFAIHRLTQRGLDVDDETLKRIIRRAKTKMSQSKLPKATMFFVDEAICHFCGNKNQAIQ